MDEETYRQKAVELRRHARMERNVSSRIEWELLALGYDRLADQARRNAQNNIIYQHEYRHEPEAPIGQQRGQRRARAQKQQQQQSLLRSKRTR